MKVESTTAIIVGLVGAAIVVALFVSSSFQLNAGLEGYFTDPAAWAHSNSANWWFLTFAYFCMVIAGIVGLVAVLLSRRYIATIMGAASASLIATVTLVLTEGAAMIGFLLLTSTQHQLPYVINYTIQTKESLIIDIIMVVLAVVAATVWSIIIYMIVGNIKSDLKSKKQAVLIKSILAGAFGFIGIAVIMLVLMVISILCVWTYLLVLNSFQIHDSIPTYSYYGVSVTGLSDYTSSGDEVVVLVPAAMFKGKPVVNATGVIPSQDFARWNVSTVDTEHGKMVRFTTTDHDLNDIEFGARGNFVREHDVLAFFNYTTLSPQVGNVTALDRGFTYPSYIYLDPGMQAHGPGNHTIHIKTAFFGHPGIIDSEHETIEATVECDINESQRGYVPVQVVERAHPIL